MIAPYTSVDFFQLAPPGCTYDDRTDLFTFKLIFYTLAPIGIIVLITFTFAIRKRYARDEEERRDIDSSAIFYMLFFTFLCFVSCSAAVVSPSCSELLLSYLSPLNLSL